MLFPYVHVQDDPKIKRQTLKIIVQIFITRLLTVLHKTYPYNTI